MTVSFHQVEEYGEDSAVGEPVVCSFKTDRFGILQVGRVRGKTIEYGAEPDLYNFTKSEREYIEATLAILFKLVHDVPAPERFK